MATMKHIVALMLPLITLAMQANADPPVVEKVVAGNSSGGWRFDVTLTHPDTGWDHYADGWRVLDMEGNELDIRVLVHPHVDEQPFTRSLGGVVLAQGTTQVQIQARCQVDGWNSETTIVTIP